MSNPEHHTSNDMSTFLGGLELAFNGKGNNPLDRFPWG